MSRDGKPAGGVIAACGDRIPTRVELHTVDVGSVALVLVLLLFLNNNIIISGPGVGVIVIS